MLKFRTVYPYGLNAKIVDESLGVDENPIFSKFPRLARQFIKGTNGSSQFSNEMSTESFLANLNTINTTNIKEAINSIHVSIHSLSKKVLKNIFIHMEDI